MYAENKLLWRSKLWCWANCFLWYKCCEFTFINFSYSKLLNQFCAINRSWFFQTCTHAPKTIQILDFHPLLTFPLFFWFHPHWNTGKKFLIQFHRFKSLPMCNTTNLTPTMSITRGRSLSWSYTYQCALQKGNYDNQ